eukprot:2712055-Amphidinium_carterae.1
MVGSVSTMDSTVTSPFKKITFANCKPEPWPCELELPCNQTLNRTPGQDPRTMALCLNCFATVETQ